MREGGKRYVVASPGPMQRQGTKSLLWVVGLSQALEEAGGESMLHTAAAAAALFAVIGMNSGSWQVKQHYLPSSA
jgi:hypothetical protein